MYMHKCVRGSGDLLPQKILDFQTLWEYTFEAQVGNLHAVSMVSSIIVWSEYPDIKHVCSRLHPLRIIEVSKSSGSLHGEKVTRQIPKYLTGGYGHVHTLWYTLGDNVIAYIVNYFPVCTENYFLNDGGSCEQCPQNSMSSRGANICTCFMNYTTMNGSHMTTEENCVCGENYHIVGSGQCVQCPANSLRAIMSQPSMCTCESNRLTGNGSTTTSGFVACDGELTYRQLLKSIIY